MASKTFLLLLIGLSIIVIACGVGLEYEPLEAEVEDTQNALLEMAKRKQKTASKLILDAY